MIEEKQAVLRHLTEQYNAIDAETVGKYRAVFSSAAGQVVLNDLLNALYVNHNFLTSEIEAVVHSFGRLVLAKCGANHPDHVTDLFLVNQLWHLPALPYREAGEEE